MAVFESRKLVASEFIYGVGARHRLGDSVQNMRANRALIVTDPGVTAAGWLRDQQNELDASKIQCEVYQSVTLNLLDREVMTGVNSGIEQGLAEPGVTFSELPEPAKHAVHAACPPQRHRVPV